MPWYSKACQADLDTSRRQSRHSGPPCTIIRSRVQTSAANEQVWLRVVGGTQLHSTQPTSATVQCQNKHPESQQLTAHNCSSGSALCIFPSGPILLQASLLMPAAVGCVLALHAE